LFGDPCQFGAIQDQGKGPLDFDNPFFWRLVNGLQLHLNKFRRGGDAGHFNFVGSLYRQHRPRLGDTLVRARTRYPVCGKPMGTVLCISHAGRVRHNAEMNERVAPPGALLIKAPKVVQSGVANVPQDMSVWPGLVLMAACNSTHRVLKNGLRYRVEEVGENLTLLCIGDRGEARGEPFALAVGEAKNLLLTHALCYFSTQARTIYGPMCLAQTAHPRFEMTHLIVGLGRWPAGADIEQCVRGAEFVGRCTGKEAS
jgi:hypothetical protein